MAGLVKALVLGTDGKIKEKANDEWLGEVNLPSGLNGNAGTITAGMILYHTGVASTLDKARANATGTMDVDGFCVADSTTGSAIFYQDSGILKLTTTQWDAVTGQTGGLTPGSEYFADSATAGKITTTPPSSGNIVQCVGTAQSTEDFHINLMPSIKRA